MPWAPLRRCGEPGCNRRQTASRCELHRTRQARGYDAAWDRVRIAILARDRYRCRIAGPGCTTRATSVDHIVPLAVGGGRLDPANLRAACGHCNTSLGARVVRTGGPGR